MQHFVGRLGALVGPAQQKPGHQALEPDRHIATQGRQGRGRLVEVAEQKIGRFFGPHQRALGQQVKEHRPKRVKVRTLVAALAHGLLGAEIGQPALGMGTDAQLVF